jgi:hypothetical protein
MPTAPTPETSSDPVSARTSRRAFMFGGVVLAGGAALAACGRETPPPAPLTGDVPEVPETTTTTNPGSPTMDRTLLRTGQSIELAAVETYDTLLDSEFLENPTTTRLESPGAITRTQLLQRLRAQHKAHADALADPIRAAGGTPVTEPNQYMTDKVIQPLVDAIADDETLMVTAHDLEAALAQTWTEATGVFTTGELRVLAMSIGGAEARNITAINFKLGYTPVPLPLLPTRAALDPRGRLED